MIFKGSYQVKLFYDPVTLWFLPFDLIKNSAGTKDHLSYFKICFRMLQWVVRGARCYTDRSVIIERKKQGKKPDDPMTKQRSKRKSTWETYLLRYLLMERRVALLKGGPHPLQIDPSNKTLLPATPETKLEEGRAADWEGKADRLLGKDKEDRKTTETLGGGGERDNSEKQTLASMIFKRQRNSEVIFINF